MISRENKKIERDRKIRQGGSELQGEPECQHGVHHMLPKNITADHYGYYHQDDTKEYYKYQETKIGMYEPSEIVCYFTSFPESSTEFLNAASRADNSIFSFPPVDSLSLMNKTLVLVHETRHR